MSPNRRGLLLDLDGTLAQSLNLLEGIYYRFLEAYGREGSLDEFTRLNGPPFAEVVGTLKQVHGLEASLQNLMAGYLDLIRESYDVVEPNPGALDLVMAAESSGWRVGVVTSNTLEIAGRWLRHVGLSSRITSVTTAEMVARGKPHPDIYVKALEDCDCLAACSWAVEDTAMGAASAMSAGLKTYLLAADGDIKRHLPDGIEGIRSLADLVPLVGR